MKKYLRLLLFVTSIISIAECSPRYLDEPKLTPVSTASKTKQNNKSNGKKDKKKRSSSHPSRVPQQFPLHLGYQPQSEYVTPNGRFFMSMACRDSYGEFHYGQTGFNECVDWPNSLEPSDSTYSPRGHYDKELQMGIIIPFNN